MIVVLGASGYIGSAFVAELQRRGASFTALSRNAVDYTRFEPLLAWLRSARPSFLVNAAGFTGKPNVDACEQARAETLLGNAMLPATIGHACAAAGVPWGHISSGCIYSGGKVRDGDGWRVERDLARPELRAQWGKGPELFAGFTEQDEPNFSFRRPPCSFYSGSKALGEEALCGVGQAYIWRLRIPFDGFDGPRNYLSKLQRYARVYDNLNSISHRADYARACLDLWDRRAPFGTYNVTNPGFISAHEAVGMIQRILNPPRSFEFFADDAEFYRSAAQTPRSNCLMEVSKLLATGVTMRPVLEALEHSLRNWQPEPKSV